VTEVAGRSAAAVARRPDLAALEGYHSPQVDVDVRLNTNESPVGPPDGWLAELLDELRHLAYHRYPDRQASALRAALAAHHGVEPEEVFCGVGSNEVLQCLALAYGGPGRTAATFEPSYALHRQIAQVTGTAVTGVARRPDDFAIDVAAAVGLLRAARPVLTFICSPNNPTGGSTPPEVVETLLAATDGLVVVDEAYGQFAPASALALRRSEVAGFERLVVVRTFSKTWAMAALRLGYLIADPAVVAACELVALPYHVDAVSQIAGRLALGHVAAMEDRVAGLVDERRRIEAGLDALAVTRWPSDANFVLFRPTGQTADAVWQGLVDRSVLVRNCSRWPGLAECLRVTVGTPQENDRFLEALAEVLHR
jgi:histidinol-phosphate aminotransferase